MANQVVQLNPAGRYNSYYDSSNMTHRSETSRVRKTERISTKFDTEKIKLTIASNGRMFNAKKLKHI